MPTIMTVTLAPTLPTWAVQQKLLHSSATAGDMQPFTSFNNYVAIDSSGSNILVGLRGFDPDGAFVYWSRGGATWTEEEQFESSDPDSSFYGTSVAISADGLSAVAGDDVGDSSDGFIEMLTRSGSTWTGNQSFPGGQDDRAGRQIDMSANGLYAIRNRSSEPDFEIYFYNGSTWAQQASFGIQAQEVAINAAGDVAVMFSLSGTDAIRVYTRTGTNWSLADSITANNIGGTGLSISDDGSVIALGAISEGSGEGRIRIYDWNGSSISLSQTITPMDVNGGNSPTGEGWGKTVQLSGDGERLVFGSWDISTNVTNGGGAQLWQLDGTWQFETMLTPNPTVSANDYYGSAIAINTDGTYIAVAAGNDNDAATDAGAVYVWNLG